MEILLDEYSSKVNASSSSSRFKIPIIMNKGAFRLRWEMFIIFLTLWVAISEPFNITFLNSSSDTEVYYLVNGILIESSFLIDIFIQLRTSYLDEKTSEEIFEGKIVAKHYILKGPFVVDCLACIPWFMTRIFVTERFSRINRLLKVYRLLNITNLLLKLKASPEVKYTVKLSQLMIFIVYLSHIGACIWNEIINVEKAWLPGIQSVSNGDFYSEGIWKKYLFCFYYQIVMQTQGSEVWPTTRLETGFVVTTEILGLLITTILYSNILFFVDKYTDEATSKVNTDLEIVEDVCQFIDIPENLRTKIIEYVERNSNRHVFHEEWVNFMSSLPSSIEEIIRISVFVQILSTSQANTLMPTRDFYKFINRLELQTCDPDDNPFVTGQKAEKMFVICSGRIELFFESLTLTRESKKICCEVFEELTTGQIFGVGGLLSYSKKYAYTARSLYHSTVAFLDKKSFKELFFKHDSLMNALKTDVYRRHYGLESLTGDFRYFMRYLKDTTEVDEIYQICTTVKRLFVKEKTILLSKTATTDLAFYLEQGQAQLVVRNSKIVLETLGTGSVYGIYSILISRMSYFQIEISADSLIQVMYKKDLEMLRKKIRHVNLNCLAYTNINRSDFIVINKETIEPIDLSPLGFNSTPKSIFECLLSTRVKTLSYSPLRKLKRTLIKVLTGQSSKKSVSMLYNIEKLWKLKGENSLISDQNIFLLIRQIIDKQNQVSLSQS